MSFTDYYFLFFKRDFSTITRETEWENSFGPNLRLTAKAAVRLNANVLGPALLEAMRDPRNIRCAFVNNGRIEEVVPANPAQRALIERIVYPNPSEALRAETLRSGGEMMMRALIVSIAKVAQNRMQQDIHYGSGFVVTDDNIARFTTVEISKLNESDRRGLAQGDSKATAWVFVGEDGHAVVLLFRSDLACTAPVQSAVRILCKFTPIPGACAYAGCRMLYPQRRCCGSVRYCEASCQKADWPLHKAVCERRDEAKSKRQEAASSAGGKGGSAPVAEEPVKDPCARCGQADSALQCDRCPALYCSKLCRHKHKSEGHKHPHSAGQDSHGAAGA